MFDLSGAWTRLNHIMIFVLVSVFLTFTGMFAVSSIFGADDDAAIMAWLKTLAMFGPLGILSSIAYILRLRFRRRD